MRHCWTVQRRTALRIAFLSLLTLFFAAPSWANSPAADPAAAKIQNFYDVLLDSMKHAKSLGVKGRYAKLKPVVEETFALQDMMRLAAGPAWLKLSDAEKKGLTEAFEKKTIAEYASNFDDFNGETFTVDPNVRSRGTDKIVSSTLIAGKMKVTFGYRMRQTGGAWKVLDIYLNGVISQLATQRSDFSAILAKQNGADKLQKQLNAKAAKLLSGN